MNNITEKINRIALAHKDKIAVCTKYGKITYSELEEKSNIIANLIEKTERETNTKINKVAIFLKDQIEIICSIVGTLKCNKFYIPLDVTFPLKKIGFMLNDSGAEIIITDADNYNYAQRIIEETKCKGYIYNITNSKNECSSLVNSENNKGESGYILYTSGTTGNPKGVIQKSESIFYMIEEYFNTIGITSDDIVGLVTSFNHTVAAIDMFSALLTGATIAAFDLKNDGGIESFIEWIKKEKITVYHSVPTLFRNICYKEKKVFNDIRLVILGGEAVLKADVDLFKNKFASHSTMVNLFGASEVIVASYYKIKNDEPFDKKIVPIGKPFKNVEIFVVDENGEEADYFEEGEIIYRSKYLSSGYHNLETETNKSFIFENSGETIFKSGDIGKVFFNNKIEYLGRKDFQIKIRGIRVEVGEIESVINEIPGIKNNVVVKAENKNIEALAVYYETINNEKIEEADFRSFLSKRISDYMIPAYYIYLEEIPLNENGKIDRKKLPKIYLKNTVRTLPQNDLQKQIYRIWADELRLKEIDINDNFFSLGGNSLSALNIADSMRNALNIPIMISDIYNNPTIMSLSHFVESQNQTVDLNYQDIPAANHKENYVLSSSQKRIYVLEKMEKSQKSYNETQIFIIEGNLDLIKLQKCINELVKKYEILRTTFEFVNNEPVQLVHEKCKIEIENINVYNDINDSENIKNALVAFIKEFDLKKLPLMRVGSLKVDETTTYIVFDVHHIIMDGSSLRILINELINLYNGKDIEFESTIQYKDYSEWQNALLDSPLIIKQKKYWTEKLKGELPILNIRTDYNRGVFQSFEGNTLFYKIEKETYDNLCTVSSNYNVSMYTLLISGLYILLSKYSGQSDILIGSPVACRNNINLKKAIGVFINTIVIRANPQKDLTLKEFVKNISNTVNEALENQDYPFENLLNDLELSREMSRNPIFDIYLIYQNMCYQKNDFQGTKSSVLKLGTGVSKFDITFKFEPDDKTNSLLLSVEYSTKLFCVNTIENMVKHYLYILNIISSCQNSKLKEIQLVDNKDKELLLYKFNSTDSYYTPTTIINEFQKAVKANEDKVSLIVNDKQYTYKQLDDLSNCVANALINEGISSKMTVGVMIDRSIEIVASLLGVLKVGAAYIPIDPYFPNDRVKYILQDSNCKCLLLSEKVRGLEGINQILVDFNTLTNTSSVSCEHNVNDLMYVIYTSGSSGNPKGVMIENDSVINFLYGVQKAIKYNPGQIMLSLTTVSFDIFVLELYLPLINGGKVVLANNMEQRDPKELIKLIKKEQINIIQTTPSRYQGIIEVYKNLGKIPEHITSLLIGGEPLKESLFYEIKNLYSGKIYNMYGPTETTVWSTVEDLTYENRILIGKPIDNTYIYILDVNGNICPIGVYGELCIGGKGLARGYLNRPELTDEKYKNNPFEKGRIYKTGDLACWTFEGKLQIAGRLDQQVKIRGYRIELEEIEVILGKMQDITGVAVVKNTGVAGEDILCAYFTANVNYKYEMIRDFLLDKLPDYMIPSFAVQLKEFPLTPNGKIDKKRLPQLDIAKERTYKEYTAPSNEFQSILAKIWGEVLGVINIGIDDDFYYLGGNSLNAVKIELLAEKEGLNVSTLDILKYRTIRNINLKNESSFAENIIEKNIINEKKSNRLEISNIYPFNDIFFKNCFYNSAFPIIKHFNRDVSTYLINSIPVFNINSKLGIVSGYCDTKEIYDLLTDDGIICNYKTISENLLLDIKDSINKGRPVIIWVDCYYEPLRKDTYKKKHLGHTWLVYGYDDDNKQLNIIEHKYSDNLTYEKQIISYDDACICYKGYLEMRGEKSKYSFYEFTMSDDNKRIMPLTEKQFIQICIQNHNIILKNESVTLEYINSLYMNLKNSIIEKDAYNDIIKDISEMLKVRQVEEYLFKSICNSLATILTELINAITELRVYLIKILYSGVKKDNFESILLSKLQKLKKFNISYYNLLKQKEECNYE